MIKIILSTLIGLLLIFSFSETQLEVNQEAQNKFRRLDSEMNFLYLKKLRVDRSDFAFISLNSDSNGRCLIIYSFHSHS